jgi:predicted phosphodiesterase
LEYKLTKEQWLNNLCRNHMVTNTRDLSTEQVQKWLTDYINVFGSVCTEESFRRGLRKAKKNYLIECGMLEEGDLENEEKEGDLEILEANVRFKKEKQKFMDTNRVERASFREYARIENAVSAYGEALVELMKKEGKELSKFNPDTISPVKGKEVGIVHISDLHINELIDLPHNKYDIEVASHRLFKLATESIIMFNARGITEIVIANTADNLNADHRLDKLLNQATNRSKATFMAVDLLKHFILHLSQHFKISYVGVIGNESRVNKEMTFSDSALSDSYDYVINQMLKLLFESSGNTNVTFGSIDTVETIIEVKGHKVLVTHDIPKSTGTQKGTQSAIGMRYLLGEKTDVIISGHIHSCKLEAYSYRCSSLAGSNSFNEHAMHLAGHSSQNIYFFGEGYRHPMTIDLQNYVNGECYDIKASLMEYHCKSVDKTRKTETIMSIVI